jgi:hypothetical protein
MKSIVVLALATLAITPFASAAEAGFPEADPEVAIAVPEGWNSHYEDGRLYVTTPDELSVVVEVSALKSTKQEGAKALEEMKNEVNSAFENVTFQPMQEGSSNNVGLYIINGKGEDENGKVNLNAIMVTNGENDKLYFVFVASSPEAGDEHGEDIAAILSSIHRIE